MAQQDDKDADLHPDARVAGWQPPRHRHTARRDVDGALGGSRLFDQPQYRAEAERFAAFIEPPGPVIVEVGFDHGHRLRALAESTPSARYVGLEVRQARVEALAERAPPNLLPWRADARTIFARLMPARRLDRVDVLFPTPWWHAGHRAKRLLLTPEFIERVGRSLNADGTLYVATDVGPYFEHVESLMAAWTAAPPPAPSPIPSRREKRCMREDIAVFAGAWRPPTR